MDFQHKEEKGVNYLDIGGELDASAAIQVDAKISEILETGKSHIIIDLERLSYISSAGMGAFISHLEDIKEMEGKLIFCNMQENIRTTFELLGLLNLVHITKGINEAKEKLDES